VAACCCSAWHPGVSTIPIVSHEGDSFAALEVLAYTPLARKLMSHIYIPADYFEMPHTSSSPRAKLTA
jgi:hypothetical protein